MQHSAAKASWLTRLYYSKSSAAATQRKVGGIKTGLTGFSVATLVYISLALRSRSSGSALLADMISSASLQVTRTNCGAGVASACTH